MAGTPEHMREIGAKTRFCGERAAKAQQKSVETRVQIGRLKHAAEKVVTPKRAEEIIEALATKAASGDVQASTFLRDLLGEKPVEKVEQTVNEISFRVEGVSAEEADELFG